MWLRRLLSLCGVSLLGAGCAIHPVPENVTGYNTHQIVQKIRCEMRDAIRAAIIAQLKRNGEQDAVVAARLESDPSQFQANKLRPLVAQLSPASKQIIDKYDSGAIAYEFTFNMIEINNLTTQFGFGETFKKGSFGLALSTGNDRERDNKRNFRMLDIAKPLVTDFGKDFCDDFSRGPNWMYPITGEIGLHEVVWTFYQLNESGKLIAADNESLPTMSDTIEFTTKVSGNVNPTVTISPLGGDFQLASAGMTAAASREDIHTLRVVLTLPADKKVPVIAAPGTRPVPSRVVRVQRTIQRTAPTNDPGEAAVQELNRQDFLDPTTLGGSRSDIRRLIRALD